MGYPTAPTHTAGYLVLINSSQQKTEPQSIAYSYILGREKKIHLIYNTILRLSTVISISCAL